MSNVLTTFIVGGGILMYHLYRKHKEQQYYKFIKEQINDGLVIGLKVYFYYMASKGIFDLNTIKTLIENNPVFNTKHIQVPNNFYQNLGQLSAMTHDKFMGGNKYKSYFNDDPIKFCPSGCPVDYPIDYPFDEPISHYKYKPCRKMKPKTKMYDSDYESNIEKPEQETIDINI